MASLANTDDVVTPPPDVALSLQVLAVGTRAETAVKTRLIPAPSSRANPTRDPRGGVRWACDYPKCG